jgi:heme A synthase
MRERFALTPRAYQRVAVVALVALTVIVITGAAVRLTGSGLGCPDWPKCYGKAIAPLETHAVIEYGNRILSGLVGFAAIAAFVGAWLRRPRRTDLLVLGALLPLGVLGQAVLGGFTVRNHLAPGFVMGHYGLAMVILIAAVALVWRATYEPAERPPATDRVSLWAARALVPLGAVTIFAGTAATASGPHAGGEGTGDEINRRSTGFTSRAQIPSTGRSSSTRASPSRWAWPQSGCGCCCAAAARTPGPSARSSSCSACSPSRARWAPSSTRSSCRRRSSGCTFPWPP